jgi:hypothetical protein
MWQRYRDWANFAIAIFEELEERRQSTTDFCPECTVKIISIRTKLERMNYLLKMTSDGPYHHEGRESRAGQLSHGRLCWGMERSGAKRRTAL